MTLPPDGTRTMRQALEVCGLEVQKVPGTHPEWIVLGTHPTATVTHRNNRWYCSDDRLQILIDDAFYVSRQNLRRATA